jgi:hypothetical protein
MGNGQSTPADAGRSVKPPVARPWTKGTCQLVQDGADFCSPMERALNAEANARQKGLCIVVVTDLQTAKSRVIGVAYKTAANDSGVMLNTCPWCKEPILWDEEWEASLKEI